MFCSCYFSVFLCRVLALVFALEEGGGGSQLKSSVAFRLLSALLIVTLSRDERYRRPREPACKISKYLETRRLTEDVFGECGRKPWRGDTPHTRESLLMSKIKNYRDFWFPYKNCRGGQIPCENYCALP